MTGAGIKKRLRRLETRQEGEGRIVVVTGFCEEEHEAKIAEMEQRGEIGSRDTVVCVANYCNPPQRRPGVKYFCDVDGAVS
jgi:dihydrodipicolinate synthase/N-acetylneuraminate lyase